MGRKLLVVLHSLFLVARILLITLERRNRSADLKVSQTSDDYETQDLVLKDKGDDVKEVGPIEYNVDSLGNF